MRRFGTSARTSARTGFAGAGLGVRVPDARVIEIARPDPTSFVGNDPARLLLRVRSSVQKKAAALLLAAGLALPAAAVPTAAGTNIDNTAHFNLTIGSLTIDAPSNTDRVTVIEPLGRTVGVVELLQYAPGAPGARSQTTGPTRCDTGAGFTTLADPVALGGGAIDPLAPVPLLDSAVFHRGEPLFVAVDDSDHNINDAVLDSILVEITTTSAGDHETLELIETGPATGIFVGYIMTAAPPAVANDCVLSVDQGDHIVATYTDFQSVRSVAAALVDPMGVVFDSATGAPLDGASVTLIDVGTGLPASVFGDDGVATYPATVTTGGTATDSASNVYAFPPGGFRFPFVQPGNYRFQVTPPAGYVVPSVVPDVSLPPGFAIEVGSRGEVFVVLPGPALHIDIPADPFTGDLFLRKSVSTPEASIGDFVEWKIEAQNASSLGSVTGAIVTDTMPVGLRYRAGSARLDGVPLADPTISADGLTLTFAVGTIPANTAVTVSYVTQLGPGAHGRALRNSAVASGNGGVASNVAEATVYLKEDLFGDRSTLIGEVLADTCGTADGSGTGVEGVRILLEDGTYAITDERGRFHFRGVSEGTHVVQLDTTSLPEGYTVEMCDPNTRFAGRAYSQFVDLQRGALWRADFRVRKPDPSKGLVRVQLHGTALADTGEALYEYDLSSDGMVALRNLRASFLVPDGATLVAGSAVLDGAAIPGAALSDGVMTLRLGDRPAAFAHKIAFRLKLPADGADYLVRAMLTLDSGTQKNLRAPAVEVTLAPIAGSASLESGRVLFSPHFPSRSWVLTEQDRAELRKISAKAEDLRNLRIHIVGYTDGRRVRDEEFDDLKDNADLSLRRANAVADFLASELAIDRSRITTEGHGDAEPVGDNKLKDGQQLNRRVMITAVGIARTAGKDSAGESPLEQLEVVGAAPGLAAAATTAPIAEGIEDYRKNYAPYAKVVDGALLATLTPGRGFLWPSADVNPAVPSIKVAVQHLKDEKVELTLNGQPVSALSQSGGSAAADRDIAVDEWHGIEVLEGPNTLVATVRDAAGIPVATLERTVHYAGTAVRAEVLSERSTLVADGKQHPVLAVRLYDRWGHPVHPGAGGDVDVGAPFKLWRDLDDRNKDKLFTLGDVRGTWSADADGVARIELAPTTDSGKLQVTFRFSPRLTQDVSAWMEPADRDWVLVGLAEGKVGHNTVKDNAAAYAAAGGMPDYYEDGRVAFYAKGMVKGDTLLTIAYDTSKSRQTGGANLTQQIDPNSYYLLYGDATEQGNDAASIKNLYVRVERKQFYALFGDFDTALTVTELGRYSRRLNGLKSEYHGETLQYSAFASEDTTAFVKDELQGDGTSGLYHLSRDPLVINSEHVRIQTRDRFHSEQILTESTLQRFTDYTIDYTAGTLFFRRPVPNRDSSFNPVFIVVDYEVQSTGEGTFTGGGRGAITLAGGKVELGATALHEGVSGADGDLVAADVKVKLGEATELRAEVGNSAAGSGTSAHEGTAYTVKVEHLGDVVAGRVYARQQDADYGIGQQSGGESGTRKVGAEGTIKISVNTDVNGQVYVQDNLNTGAERQVAEAALNYRTDDSVYTATAGLRHAAESGLAAQDLVSDQVYAGGSAQLSEDLTVHAQGEFGVSGSSAATDYPDRLTLGADYKMTDSATAFVEHEVARGAAQSSEMTRVGVRTQPWDRARADASLEQQYSENGMRLFSTIGLAQGFQATDELLLDFGVDRVNTIRSPGDPVFNTNVPPSSGSAPNGDFTAWYTGATYHHLDWTMNGRLEFLYGELEDRWGLTAGAYRQQGERWGLAFRAGYRESQKTAGGSSTDASLSMGLVFRPTNPEYIWLDRVDLIYQDAIDPATTSSRTYKVINNLNLNQRPDSRWQTSYQYAFKWVRTEFDVGYTGFTDLVGVESRYDLTPEWDIGAQLYGLHSWDSDTLEYASGISIGHSFAKNVWLSVGYNFDGFLDEDFSGARYTVQGPFIQFRVKFDQDSYKDLQSLVAPPSAPSPVR